MTAGFDTTTFTMVICRTDPFLHLCQNPSTIATNHVTPNGTPNTQGTLLTISSTSGSPGNDPFDAGPTPICSTSNGGGGGPFWPNNTNQINPAAKEGTTYSGINIPGNEGVFNINLYPNPGSNYENIDISGASASEAILTISDVTGRVVKTQIAGLTTGLNHLTIDIQQLIPGSYILKITNPDLSINAKMQIVKY